MTSKYQQAALGELFIASGAAAHGNDGQALAAALPELAIAGARREIVFIESDVPDIDTLIRGFGAGKEVVILDAARDGLRQIADAMEGRSGIDALHVISHGQQGSVSLGSLMLDAGDVSAHAADLEAIGRGMAEGGDILLYGCDVGAGDAGLALVGSLAAATGADVAASSDLTGAAAQGGDWELEVRSGDIATPAVVDPALAAVYQRTLAATGIPSASIDFDQFEYFDKYGHDTDPDIDIVYKVNNNDKYLLKINGLTKNIVKWEDTNYIVSDSDDGSGESAIEFSFVDGQVFTPTSIRVSNMDGDPTNGGHPQKLIFIGYDASRNPVGEPQPFETLYFDGSADGFDTAKFDGLTEITRLVVKADLSSNGGKMLFLAFDDLELLDIKPAGPPAPPAPVVTSVSSTNADGAYAVGQDIFVTVTFDQAVTVAGGIPTLQLETGDNDRLATYAGGTGSNTLTFKYTVLAGDTSSDLNYFSTGSLNAGTATIKGSSGGADASLVLPDLNTADSLGGGKAIVIDTTAPKTPARPDLASGSDSGIDNSDNITNAVTQTVGGGANSVEGGSRVTLYSADLPIAGATTTAADDGSWSIDLDLTDGQYTITARSTDKAGNQGSTSDPLTLTVDQKAPAAPQAPLLHADSNSGSKADTITNDRTPTFYGVAESVEGGARVNLYADGRLIGSVVAAANGSWSLASDELDEGTYSITAEAVDIAGNVSAASSGTSLTIDFTEPSVQVGDVVFSDDTNVKGDFVTSEPNQTVSGTLTAPLAAGEWVGVSIDNGVTYSPAAVSPEGDRWSRAGVEIEGKGTLWVRVFDAAGNGGTPFSHAYELDTAAPGKPSTPDLTDASDSGDDKQDNITGVTTPTFTGTSEKDATITLYADGEAVGTAKAGADGKWSVTVDEALEGGSYAFTVSATDLAGNQGVASDALDVTIITAAPSTTNLSFSLETDSGTPGDRITNVAAQLLQGELSVALGAGEKVQVRVAGGSWQDATIVPGTTGWTLDTTLAQGAKEVEVQVVNAIGNAGPVESYEYELDTDAPTVEIESDKLELKAGETATITFTFSDAPGAAFTTDDIEVSGGALSEFDGEGLVWTAVFTPDADENGGEASFSIADGLFRDLAGNVNALSVLNTLRFDTKAPTAPQALALAIVSDSGTAGDGITSFKRPVITGDGESGTTVVLYDADDNVIGSGAVVGGKWSITLTRDLAEGENTIGARAFDAAGNASAPATGLDITLDQTPPTVSITSDVDKLKVGETATITFTFSEDPGISFTADSITVSGGELGALTKNGLTFSAEFTPTANRDATTASITIGAGGYWDAASNNGGAGTTPTLKFDTKAPPAPSIPDLDAASDTGSSNNDNITGDTTPTFTGTGEEGATVRLYIGEDEIGSGVVVDGAWSITSSTLGKGEHFVTAVATDAMGNVGPSSDALKIEILTDAPTTKATSVKFSADTGALGTDLITRTAAQTISGELSAELKNGEYVEVSVNGGTTWNVADADADGWSIATTLVAGRQEVVVRVVNAIGNSGDKYPRDYHLDTVAPTLAISSNVAALKSGQTATITFAFSEDPGTSFAWDGTAGGLVVSGGTLSPISGSGTTRTATFTPDDKFEGHPSITVNVGSYSDLAGNPGTGDTLTALDIDTLVPDQPGTPALAADSDTGAKGDGRTESTTQVIEGSGAEPGATVYLYNGNVRVGQAQAGAEGQWSIELKLGGGTYTLRVSQFDEAGNESDRSDPFQLTVTTSTPNPDPEPNPNPNPNPNPDPEPTPPTMVDGMPVTVRPVTLPGGGRGTSVEVPIVTGGRTETNGQPSLADIPLASSGGQTQLLAQLPVGYGLSSSGASVGATSGLAFLIASIKAATPTHAPDDQGHLVQNGTSFLQGLDYSSLLVHTFKPVSNPGTTDALVLTGFNPSGAQGTALVIETAGLANGASIELVDIDFAALVGAATVYTGSNGAILAGDGASQHFTVVAGNNNGVFAGGGSDLLTFAAGAPVDAGSASGRASAQQAAASGVTTLHGGRGGDAASFAGVRSDYDIEAHNGYLVVSSKAAPDAKALVVNVEELRFGDGNVAVENGAGLTTLAGMYQTVFGRQADLYGFEYWADHRDNGLSWGTIALELIASSERVAQHGDFNGDAANDIGLLYQALFNREAEAEGLAFWKAAMEERGMTLEQVATSFVESAEMVGHQRGVLDWDFLV